MLGQVKKTSAGRGRSGYQCVIELAQVGVRKLELSGGRVAEAGVHHYPRLHGRSQFFRVRSLLITFYQLLRLWVQFGIDR